MFKKSLIIVAGLCSLNCGIDAKFMDGPSAGIHYKYQKHKFTYPGAQTDTEKKVYSDLFTHNSQATGFHFDYNRPLTNTVFIGAGIEADYALNKKSDAFTTVRDTFSGAVTLRVGISSGLMALDVSGSLVGVNVKYTEKDTKGNTRTTKQFRPGFAPGIGMTVKVGEHMSLGAVYRYEFYKEATADMKANVLSDKRIRSHTGLVKLSYHF